MGDRELEMIQYSPFTSFCEVKGQKKVKIGCLGKVRSLNLKIPKGVSPLKVDTIAEEILST